MPSSHVLPRFFILTVNVPVLVIEDVCSRLGVEMCILRVSPNAPNRGILPNVNGQSICDVLTSSSLQK